MRLYIDYGATNFRYQYDNDEVFVFFSSEIDLKEFLDEQISQNKVSFVAISFAGQVANGKIISSPNIGIEPFDIKDYVKQKYNIPLEIENDINCATLAEGFTRISKVLTLFYIGTGLGGGTILGDNTLLRGANFLGGEFGHIPFKKTPFTCGCGRDDCLELSTSGGAILKWTKHFNLELDEVTLTNLKELDEKNATLIYNNFYEGLRLLFHTTLNFIDPDYLIIGGGVAQDETEIVEFLKKEIEKSSYNESRKRFTIEMSSFENGSLEGARLLGN